jgi:2-iminoacetate synthase
MKAEEFIDHREVLDTLAYAEANKHNATLIDSIIAKAKERKGLTHREASVLLECDIKEKNDEIFALAKQIKQDFYGNRIVIFAPLYLSNYCVNGCVYCPYHAKNKHIPRKKLTQEEIAREVTALQDMGHKRLLSRRGRTLSIIQLNIFLNPSRRFTPSSIKTAPSGASTSYRRHDG